MYRYIVNIYYLNKPKLPTRVRGLDNSGKFPMDMNIFPLETIFCLSQTP